MPEEGSRPKCICLWICAWKWCRAVVLEDLETAIARGAKIYEILGGNVNSGARGLVR
jgi:hypothetical protein